VRFAVFQGRRVQIIDIDDPSGEHAIEFVDPSTEASGAVLAVYSSGKEWSDARVSISPKVESLAAEFVEWALRIARQEI
jgi:hypothetical protein